jgi:undecaprenyl-diphosphatase
VNTFEAIVLGIIQGLTEFFPISSSGHLILIQSLFGLTNLENYILFDLVCHLGTLCAIFLTFASQIKNLLTIDRSRFIQIIVGTLPLFPLVLFLKPIEEKFGEPKYLGFYFFCTALLLFIALKRGKEISPHLLEKKKWRDALTIGIFQAVAIFPGISRSGSTLSGASLLGWNRQNSVTFSFLLAIPAILGGTTIQLIKFYVEPSFPSLESSCYYAGFLSSFIVGYFALSQLIKLAMKGKLMYFVWYCLILGSSTILYFQ